MDAKKWAPKNCLLSDKKSLIRQSFNFCFQNKWFFWFRNLECRGPRVGSLCVEKHVHYLCRTFLFFLIHTIHLQKPQSFTQLHRAQSFISIYNMYTCFQLRERMPSTPQNELHVMHLFEFAAWQTKIYQQFIYRVKQKCSQHYKALILDILDIHLRGRFKNTK